MLSWQQVLEPAQAEPYDCLACWGEGHAGARHTVLVPVGGCGLRPS